MGKGPIGLRHPVGVFFLFDRGAAIIGSIDQFSDSVDLRCSPTLRTELRALYGEKLPRRASSPD